MPSAAAPAKKKSASVKPAKRPAPAPKPLRPVQSSPAGAAPRRTLNRATRRRLRLLFGSLFLLAGVFIGLSIVSYYFTWKTDQDLLLRSGSLRGFVLHGIEPVANWCGRLGAALSHFLVYRGVGVAALAVGLFTAAFGANILYGTRAVPFMRYTRWLALILLVAAPILAYLFPNASFPWGGALGSEAVTYGEGLLGWAGTGAVLLGAAAFVLFGILALDVSPLVARWRRRVRAMREERAARLAGRRDLSTFATEENDNADDDDDEISFDEEGDDDDEPVNPTMQARADAIAASLHPTNALNGDAHPLDRIEEGISDGKVYDLALSQKEAAVSPKTLAAGPLHTSQEADTPTFFVEKAAGDAAPDAEEFEEDAELPSPLRPSALSFEVVTQKEEEPALETIRHGAHISVESGEPYAPELDLPDYKFPTLDLLEARATEKVALDTTELEQNKTQIINTLRSFGIEIQRISATVGPTVTLYEIIPAEGVRISKIRNLEDDIALALSALGIRIIAPIPGKGTIGIEVPNANKQIVSMQALLASDKFVHSKMSLPIALGKTISNENYIVDLATMPHLLMAGATGQGKSVGINAILVSLLYKKHPSQLKFVLVDPKKVELSIYRTIEKHFLAKLPNEEEAIITDTKKVIYTLNALCIEMDNRYELLKEAGARNIKEYNDKFIGRRLNPERGHKFLPFIVLVVDEFADLIMTAGKEVEMPIARLAQLARAVGIHLIIATQRPSVNVITGTIKANFPGRVAFKVSAKVDSRTILDAGGAEQLVGRGDMLVSHGSELLRVQCAFVDTPEVENVCDFIGNQRGYPHAFELPEYEGEDGDSEKSVVDLQNRDKLFDDCARVVVSTQSGSTSMLQRRFNLGYNRAGRIMDQLEAASIVGPAAGSKPREVLFHTEVELEQFLQQLG